MVIYQRWFSGEECATDREGCVMIDVKRKIDVPDGAICIDEQRPEIKIVDDDCFKPRAAIDSFVTNFVAFLFNNVYKKKNNIKSIANYFFSQLIPLYCVYT